MHTSHRTVYAWMGVNSGIPGLDLNYVVFRNEGMIELCIDRGKGADEENKRIFDQLYMNRENIEKNFGANLIWEKSDGKRACRILYLLKGKGYRSPEERWPATQDTSNAALGRLERALRPYLTELKISA